MESSELVLRLFAEANLFLYVGDDAIEKRSPRIRVEVGLLGQFRQTLGLKRKRE